MYPFSCRWIVENRTLWIHANINFHAIKTDTLREKIKSLVNEFIWAEIFNVHSDKTHTHTHTNHHY